MNFAIERMSGSSDVAEVLGFCIADQGGKGDKFASTSEVR